MSELPPAPPVSGGDMPPEPNRWLGQRAPYWGIATGLLAYLPALALAIAFLADPPSQPSHTEDYSTGIYALQNGMAATCVVLVAAIVLVIIPRTRGFGAGLAIALAIGVIGGSGICVSMASVA